MKLYNKKDRKQLLKEVKEESFSRITCSFYKYVALDALSELRDNLYFEWAQLGILGRVYLAKEGVNAQVSVPESCWDSFVKNVNSRKEFQGIKIKQAIEEGISFIKLMIKIRKEIVAYYISEEEYDMNRIGKYLDSEAFNQAIDDGALVVDMRNQYESEIGRFTDAVVPQVERSQELLPEVKRLLIGSEEKPILLYCTGGVRCEKASAYLIHHGFKNVHQLEGGVIEYVNTVKKKGLVSKFKGKNFVFDRRMGESITQDILSQCHQCGKAADTHVNCANEACHILFIQCESCSKKYQQCCTITCADFISLPKTEQKYLFKKNKVKFTAQLSNKIKPRLMEEKELGPNGRRLG